jgi:hypothetical protein
MSWQVSVGPALDQAEALLEIAVAKVVPMGLAQGDQLGAGTDGPDHETWFSRGGVLTRHFSGDLGGPAIQLPCSIGQSELAEDQF